MLVPSNTALAARTARGIPPGKGKAGKAKGLAWSAQQRHSAISEQLAQVSMELEAIKNFNEHAKEAVWLVNTFRALAALVAVVVIGGIGKGIWDISSLDTKASAR
jgi:hypothetical protein